jgi:hypothetical protein
LNATFIALGIVRIPYMRRKYGHVTCTYTLRYVHVYLLFFYYILNLTGYGPRVASSEAGQTRPHQT